MSVTTKAGTGAGALLVVSATAATLAVPAPPPVTTPARYSLGTTGAVATLTLGYGGASGYTSAAGLPTNSSAAGLGATITTVAASGVITSGTLVAPGGTYVVGEKVYIVQGGGVGNAYFVVSSITGAVAPTGVPVLQMKDFTMPSQKYSFDEVTNTSSPTIGVSVLKENQITTLDPGEFSCTGIFLPSDPGLILLQSAFSSGIAQAFQILLPPIAGQAEEGNVYAFNAWLSENPVPSNVSADKAVTVKITLKLSSLMTIAVGI